MPSILLAELRAVCAVTLVTSATALTAALRRMCWDPALLLALVGCCTISREATAQLEVLSPGCPFFVLGSFLHTGLV